MLTLFSHGTVTLDQQKQARRSYDAHVHERLDAKPIKVRDLVTSSPVIKSLKGYFNPFLLFHQLTTFYDFFECASLLPKLISLSLSEQRLIGFPLLIYIFYAISMYLFQLFTTLYVKSKGE